MKSFIKGIWSRTEKEPDTRKLDHPDQLQVGDMIQLSDSYGLPARLRDQAFKVTGITTQQFEHEFATTFALMGNNQDEIDLTIEGRGETARAVFSLSIERSIVEQVFDLDEFALIFDGESPAAIYTRAQLDMDAWLAPEYHQYAIAERGYFYESDYRVGGPPRFEGSGEPFDFFGLRSPDGAFGVEIEVYDGGETEVCLTLNRPIDDIKELWPAATPKSH